MESIFRLAEELRTPASPDALGAVSRLRSPNAAVIIEWLEWCRDTRGRRESTLKSYSETMTAWLVAVGAEPILSPSVASVARMEDFLSRPRVGRGAGSNGSPATRAREASTLRSFYLWVFQRGMTERNLAELLCGPSVHNENPRPVPDHDWMALWSDPMLDDDQRIVLGLGFYCGLRRQEIADLRCGQITKRKIENFTRKGGGEDTFPWRELIGVLDEAALPFAGGIGVFVHLMRRRAADGHTDPNQRITRWESGQTLTLGVPTWFEKAGAGRYTPHQLRHSACTNMLRCGIPLHYVTRLMNHANPTVTMRYVKAGGDELREWRRTQNAGLD